MALSYFKIIIFNQTSKKKKKKGKLVEREPDEKIRFLYKSAHAVMKLSRFPANIPVGQ